VKRELRKRKAEENTPFLPSHARSG
jgi:hypothetical protein